MYETRPRRDCLIFLCTRRDRDFTWLRISGETETRPRRDRESRCLFLQDQDENHLLMNKLIEFWLYYFSKLHIHPLFFPSRNVIPSLFLWVLYYIIAATVVLWCLAGLPDFRPFTAEQQENRNPSVFKHEISSDIRYQIWDTGYTPDWALGMKFLFFLIWWNSFPPSLLLEVQTISCNLSNKLKIYFV